MKTFVAFVALAVVGCLAEELVLEVPSIVTEEPRITFEEDAADDIILHRRQTDACVNNATVRINNMTCDRFFASTGIAHCNNEQLENSCCASIQKYCQTCSDVPGTQVNGESCLTFFRNTGTQFCGHDELGKRCCGSRKLFCTNCHGDTANVKLNGMTCGELFAKEPTKHCHESNTIVHCCATRNKNCPCTSDVWGALLFINGKRLSCPAVFQEAKNTGRTDYCSNPNLWQFCCKSQQQHCPNGPTY